MSYKIAVASGKGGTGKTTVSLNLNHYLKCRLKYEVRLVDCDVEEPNDLLFYPDATLLKQEEVVQMVPAIDSEQCVFCGRCEEYCAFNAISIIPNVKYAKVDSALCHSCGACLYACEEDAITEYPEPIGQVSTYLSQEKCMLTEGRLKVGSSMQTLLIKELKKRVEDDVDIVIYDAPPGTSCSVVETTSDVDFVILVAEPTPFGLHDLKLMVELMRNLARPFALVINKAGLGNDEIYTYIQEEEIPLLGEIPFSEAYASLYAKGEIRKDIPQEIAQAYEVIVGGLPFFEKESAKAVLKS